MSDMKETDFPPPEPQPFVTEEGREIERLRAELAAERATTASLLRIIALIREAGGLARGDLYAMPDAVKAMRQQRDELVAERDALQSKIDSMTEAMHSIARRQVALEEETEERQSIGLRERLVCAIWPEIMRQWREYKDAIDPRGDARSDALVEADKMLAAMRKGATDGK